MSNHSNVTPLHGGITLSSEPARPLAPAQKVRQRAYEENQSEAAEPWPFGETSAEGIAEFIGVSIRTARRWRQDRELPKPIQTLAHILMRGDLGAIDAAWSGWSVHRGTLRSQSHREPFTVGELEHIPFTAQRVASLESSNRRLQQQIQEMRAERVESPEKAKIHRALHRAVQIERLALAMAEEFGPAIHECVTEVACANSQRATGHVDSAYSDSEGAMAGERGAKLSFEAQDCARVMKAFCVQRLADIAAEEKARDQQEARAKPEAS